VVPQRPGVAEARPHRDLVDRLAGLLQQLLREQDPLAGQPPLRRWAVRRDTGLSEASGATTIVTGLP